jgi:Ser/Thr protein kinase RdoA (MazF antagonist)
VGNLHKVSEQLARSGSLQTKRVAFDMDFHSWTTGQRMASPYLSEDLGRIVQITAQQIQKRLLTLATDANDYGFVHADLHQWNYLFSGREAGAIDFGDCGWGHYSLDLATVLQYLKYPLVGNWDHRVQYPRLKEALLSGYQEVRALPSTIEDQIETYIISRMIFTLEWMLDDWPHPDYLSWGPQFLRESMDMFADYLNQ